MVDKWAIKRGLADAINAHDMQALLDLFSEDAVLVSPAGMAEGREQIAWLYEQFFRGFPDLRLTVWYEATDTDRPMMVEWTATGTHTGPFLLPDGRELEATGRRITLRGSCASFVENEKVVTHREYFDQLELYTQLGLHLSGDGPAPCGSAANGSPGSHRQAGPVGGSGAAGHQARADTEGSPRQTTRPGNVNTGGSSA
ncbi:ester cyclase [Microbispora sp. NPDC049125]|uniref:ester cyclase n=1 Tax=Microbispora sp. NPDC049125 TaxID=3154929 RepID=UPI0034658CA2